LGLLFMLVGTALFVFYTQSGGAGLPVVGEVITSEDQIMPYFAATQLPGIGLMGLIMAGLFAAAMSTIDSGINGVTSVIVYDWLSGGELPMRVRRLLTGGRGVLVIGIINTVAGTTLGMLLAIYLLGLLVPWANLPGTMIAFAIGLVSLGLVWTYADVPKWWYGAFTMVPVFVAGMVASRFFPAPAQAVLRDTLLRNILGEKS